MADRPFESPVSIGVSYTALPLTKSDVTTYDPPLRQVDVIDGGTVVIVDGRGTSRTLTSLPAGYSIKCLVTQVMSTGTAASNFVGYP